MVDEEEILRMNFLNENIIEKGIDVEEFSNFIKEKTGQKFESVPYDKLEEMLNQFNNKNNNAGDTSKKEEKKEDNEEEKKEEEKKKEELSKKQNSEKPKEAEKEKPKEISKENLKEEPKKESKEEEQNPLYTPQEYEFKTNLQQNTKLLELSKENKLISIIVSEPKKEQLGGFFSKAIYSYRIQCPQINSDIRRTYADFEWFRNQLVIRYPLRFVPPVMRENVLKQIFKQENEDIAEQRKVRYLNKFMYSIIRKKILRTSPLLFAFLILDDKSFKNYQSKVIQKNMN